MYNRERLNALTEQLNVLRRAISPDAPVAWGWWEWPLLFLAVSIMLALGMANLDGPSLWHDELVHVHVAKNIAATGWPALPSGNFYPSSTAYNYLLALFVALFGDSAFWVRLPSVLLSGANVILVYTLSRTFLGRNVALLTLACLVLSPWHLGWARQARMYEFQMLGYLFHIYCGWRWFSAESNGQARSWGIACIGTYVLGVLTSFHSILYLGPLGAFALGGVLLTRRWDNRYVTTVVACTVLGLLSILWFRFNPNPVDRSAVFETGIGGLLLDYLRTDRYLYFRFLANNLSTGFLLLALLGTVLLVLRRSPRDLLVLLAFWAPVLVLTYLVGYRRPRFMYFAYPFYIMLSSVGLAGLLTLIRHYPRSWIHTGLALLALIFLGRLSLSVMDLARHSLETAGGAHITLACRHPQWKKPAAWIRAHRTDETLLTTTFLPIHYYVGHVDNWFPNRYTRWEYQESGIVGLGSLTELRAFLAEHPKGFYIAESSRFMMWRWHGDLLDDLGKEAFWVEEHMDLIEEASSADVQVWSWNFPDGVPE